MEGHSGVAKQSSHDEPLRVMALHALAYCPRLFYLEEVEEIRVANDPVYAGRTLHEEVAEEEDASGLITQMEWTSETLGLTGKADCLCRRDGSLIPYEHKRGRAHRQDGRPTAWPSDSLQVSAYGMLLEEANQCVVPEGRVRYHTDNVTAIVPLDVAMRQTVLDAVTEGRKLRNSTVRPPVATNGRLCARCSLAPVCLPEEERFIANSSYRPERLFPANRHRATVHVVTSGSQVCKSGDSIELRTREGETRRYPVTDVDSVVLHGFSQVTTQTLQFCAAHEVAVHWLNPSGSYMGSFYAGANAVQRRIRQYGALCDEGFRLKIAKRLVQAKVEQTLRYLLRTTRESDGENSSLRHDPRILQAIQNIRNLLRQVDQAENADTLRGYEGAAAKEYFGVMPLFLRKSVPQEMVPRGRSRRPPQDRFNAVLSYLYSLLYSSVLQAITTVGLEPAFGFFHTPRSSTPPLVLDLMELFRLIVCDMTLIGSINRLQWDIVEDFSIAPGRVWLSSSGKRKVIELYERRLEAQWKHPVVGYSLSYARLIELETRLLEKEWTQEEGLFAKFRIR